MDVLSSQESAAASSQRQCRVLSGKTVYMAVTALLVFAGLVPSISRGQEQQRIGPGAKPETPPATQAQTAQYARVPLSFEKNEGQANSSVAYLSQGSGYSLFLTGQSAVLALTRTDAQREKRNPGQVVPRPAKTKKSDIVRMDLVGVSRGMQINGTEPLPGKVSYFLGSDPDKWHADVPTYAKVKYAAVYPGVDLVFYGNQGQLEYDFVVAPGADPRVMALKFTGAKKLKLNAEGDLQVIAAHGEVAFHKPLVYQLANGKRQNIKGSFKLLAGNEVQFAIGSYDKRRELVVDPTLAYSTYLGGSGAKVPAGPYCCGDYGNAVAVDLQGNVYVTGETGSADFPVTTGAYQKTNKLADSSGHYNVFVTKLNPAGTAIIYSTFLGGTGDYYYGDSGNAIAVDSLGDAYVAGSTGSGNFPVTSSAYQKINKTYANDYTAFVTKLNPTGTALIYSTYVGGSGLDRCCSPSVGDAANGIAIDNGGEAYIAGTTYSSDFPVTGSAFQKVNNAKAIGQSNLFVTKLNSVGTGLEYSTYLGGTGYSENCCYFFSGGDFGTGIAIDGTGSAYVTGYAYSLNYPVTSGAYQAKNLADSSLNGTGAANYNAVLTKLNPAGSALEYSTYLGGTGNPYYADLAEGIAVDPECSAYVTGQAGSTNFPVTTGAFQTKDNANTYQINGFVTKFKADGTALDYSTYLGGKVDGRAFGDYGRAIQVDAAGQAYVVGTAQSLDFPVTANAFQGTNKEVADAGADYFSGNAFLTQLSATGNALVYSSFLGGSGSADGGSGGDTGLAIALDLEGNAYMTGHTLSANFPVSTGAYTTVMPAAKAGDQDSGNAFVAKFAIGSGGVLGNSSTSLTADANPAASQVKLTFTAYVQQGTACGFPPSGTVSFVIDGGAPIKVALDDTGHATYATAALATGTHTIAVSYAGDGKYKPSNATPLKETIIGPPVSISVVSGTSQTAVYGSPYPKPLVVYVKDQTGAAAPGAIVNFSGTGLKFSSPTAVTNESGQASVTVTAAASGTLTATATVSEVTGSAAFTLTATKAMLTVTAKNIVVPYGQPIPALTYVTTGFVNGDKTTVVTGAPTETTTAKQDSPVGAYPITLGQGTLSATSYTFKLINGTVTITSLGAAKAPTFSPAAGTYTSKQSVTISDSTSGAVIYYTTNGANPTTSSTKYTAPVPVTATETIKAFAVAPGYTNSSVAGATYTIK